MPSPDLSAVWAANPDLVTEAIRLLAGAVISLGGILVIGLKWIAQGIFRQVEKRMEGFEQKLDRVATSLEGLTLTTSVEIAEIKATCKGNHPHREGH